MSNEQIAVMKWNNFEWCDCVYVNAFNTQLKICTEILFSPKNIICIEYYGPKNKLLFLLSSKYILVVYLTNLKYMCGMHIMTYVFYNIYSVYIHKHKLILY